jgi:hypothetical protein
VQYVSPIKLWRNISEEVDGFHSFAENAVFGLHSNDQSEEALRACFGYFEG